MSEAAKFFEQKLLYETDASDVYELRKAKSPHILFDVRSIKAWDQGHIYGAVHFPNSEIVAGAVQLEGIAQNHLIIVYCWGPGCNGSTKAALKLVNLGYTNVKEMIGGYEYWTREGFRLESQGKAIRHDIDPLTAIS